MRVLIAGATGFIGGHLAEYLKNEGYQVEGLIRSLDKASLLDSLSVTYRIGDVTDPQSLEKAGFGEFDAVVNMVAVVGSRKPMEFFRKINVEGTKNLADTLSKAGTKRLIHLSSIAIYGQSAMDGTEELEPKRKKWMRYSLTKLESEEVLDNYPNLDITILRPGHVTGPRDRMGVLPLLFHNLRNKKFVMIDEGKAVTSFVYVKDVCRAVQLCLENPDQTKGQAYNVVSPEKVRIRDVVGYLHEEMNVPLPEKKASLASAYRKAHIVELISRVLGRTPPVTRMDIVFIASDSHFLSEKLQRLGWSSSRSVREMVREWAEWRKHYEQEKKKRKSI